MSEHPTVTVGTRVSTILYNRDRGVVYAVHGTPRPQTIRRLAGGFIAAGGGGMPALTSSSPAGVSARGFRYTTMKKE